MTIHLAGAAYVLPERVEEVPAILARERPRVEEAMGSITPSLRRRTEAGLGIRTVRVCTAAEDPYQMARRAAREALVRAGVDAGQVDLVIDYSTLPGVGAAYRPLAHRLASDLGLEASLNVNLKFSGCAAFHLAVKLAGTLMRADSRLRVALLTASDTAPEGSRSLLPITVQGDAASAVVLSRDGGRGPEILATEILTLGQLHRLIEMTTDETGRQVLRVDARLVEEEVMPVYYLHFDRLVNRVLESAGVDRNAIGRVVYSNVSGSDRDGFARSLRFRPEVVWTPALVACGHTFASDLAMNYSMLLDANAIRKGEWLLFAAAGIGFTWGVTLARA